MSFYPAETNSSKLTSIIFVCAILLLVLFFLLVPSTVEALSIIETRITTNTSDQYFPSIESDIIVWEDMRNGNNDIYKYNLTTAIESPVTTNLSWQYNPVISVDNIVWEDMRNGNSDIYMYNLTTSLESQITGNAAGQMLPAIYNDKIVWQDIRNGNYDIYLYNLTTSTETQVTANIGNQYHPAIFGDRIVWDDFRTGNYDIYSYDLASSFETQVTTNTFNQVYPAISGANVVWRDNRNGNADIYIYNLMTGQERQITTNAAEQSNPDIFNDKIVWQDNRNGNWDIYLFDLSTAKEKRVTTDTADQVYPEIYNDKIVWQDYRNGNSDVYLGTIYNPVLTQYEESFAMYEGAWIDAPHPLASGGNLKLSPIPGARATYPFSGDEVDVISTVGPIMGSIDVYIDGGLMGNVSLNNPDYLFQQTVASYSGLGAGNHILEIVSSSGLIVFDAIKAESLPYYYTHYGETSAIYSANWVDAPHTLFTDGTSKMSPGIQGDTATFYFDGSNVRIIGLKGPIFGIVDINVDGRLSGTIDLYDPAFMIQSTIMNITGISPGYHTLEIIATGNKNPLSAAGLINIDGLDMW